MLIKEWKESRCYVYCSVYPFNLASSTLPFIDEGRVAKLELFCLSTLSPGSYHWQHLSARWTVGLDGNALFDSVNEASFVTGARRPITWQLFFLLVTNAAYTRVYS
jgi:hypothetical protein